MIKLYLRHRIRAWQGDPTCLIWSQASSYMRPDEADLQSSLQILWLIHTDM